MTTKILIVGGGLAGTIIANGLCRQLRAKLRSGAASITMIGATDQHMYQPGLLYVPFGKFREVELFRDQRQVLDRQVPYFIDPATTIDVENKKVKTQSGKTFDYDYLVIATGSRIVPETVPGMAEGAHWFYDLDGARKMRAALAQFEGGKIVVNVNVPHKCPVAPLEITFMLHDYLSGRGLMEKSEITYTYPIGRLHSLEPVAQWAQPEMDRLGIKYETFFNTKEVDPEKKSITSEEGSTLEYDMLVTIPPHQGAPVITDSDLGAGGWVPTGQKNSVARRLRRRFRVRRYDKSTHLQGRVDGAFRGRHHHRQYRLAGMRGALGAELRRKSLLLRGNGYEYWNVRMVQLHHAAQSRSADSDDSLVQARLQPALLAVGEGPALREDE
jgi:sulfide:quinone oxidoreductase